MYYTTEREMNGELCSIPTENLTHEQFAKLRQEQNMVFINGDLSAYMDPKDAPVMVAASVGASTIPSLMGTCTYDDSTMINVWRQKLGIEVREISTELQKRFEAGHFFEQLIAEEFCKRNNMTLLKPTGMLIPANDPTLYCNIDFFAEDQEGEIFILEIKNPNGANHQAEVYRRVAENKEAEQMYVDQVIYQMLISGVHQGYVVYGWAGSPYARSTNSIDHVFGFPVDYDEARAQQMVNAVHTFCESLIEVDEKRLLQLPGATPKDFTLVYGLGEGEIVTDDSKWRAACDKYIRAVNAEECAKEQKSEAEKELRQLLGGNRCAIVHDALQDVTISTKKRDSKVWDTERLKEEVPDIYAEHIDFSITAAQIKKLSEDQQQIVNSCLTVTTQPASGVKVDIKKNK